MGVLCGCVVLCVCVLCCVSRAGARRVVGRREGGPKGGAQRGWGPKGGGPQGGGPKGGEARRVGGPNGGPKISRFFFPCPAAKFVLFFPLWGSSRGILVVCEAPGRRGFTQQHVNSKRAHLRVPAFKNTTKIQRRDLRETKKAKMGAREGKKSEIWGGGGSGGVKLRLSLCVHCVCLLVQHKDFVDPRTLWLKLSSVFLFT